MKKKVIDYLILGGGCSALSLIDHIMNKNIRCYNFLIIEKRKTYIDDKSWCFWDNINSNFKNLSEASWKYYSISFSKFENKLYNNNYLYYYIRSIKFYQHVMAKILKFKNIRINLNEKVINIKKNEPYYTVVTNKRSYIAKNIIDTRPRLDVYKNYPFLYQVFFGYEIKLKKNNKIRLNYNKVNLMENMKADDKTFSFNYILPIKKNHILFEYTTFSKTIFSYKYLENALKKALREKKIKYYKVIRKEYGCIPMGIVDQNKILNSKNYVYAGTAAGAVRPSSGYAFLRIQNWASICSKAIYKNGTIKSFPKDSLLLSFLDKIFLIIISKNISNTSYIFHYFSKNICSSTFVKFMSDKARFSDYVKVILAMPKRMFLKCLILK